jgi:catechol 2,3-dioxygenase-like lactoylglutathione lyase family enzyme
MPDSATTPPGARAPHPAPPLQLRVALTTADYERLVQFYCDGLGLEPAEIWHTELGRARLLDMGRGTLELFDAAQAASIDQLEAGRRVSGPVRLALQVPNLDAAVARLLAHGAALVHPSVLTPWGDRNARLQDPDGLQLTLFQSPPAPPAADPASLFRRHVAVWENGDLAQLGEIIDVAYVGHVAAGDRDREGLKARIRAFRALYPDIVFTIEDQLVAGDRVATRLTARGTHAVTGQAAHLLGHNLSRVSGDKIVEEWAAWEPRTGPG